MIPAVLARNGDIEFVVRDHAAFDLLAVGERDGGRNVRAAAARIQQALLQIERADTCGDAGQIAGGRMALGASAGAVEVCLAGRPRCP